MLLGWGSPLLPVQLLFINLVADGLPGFALSCEPMLTNVMNQPPMPKNAQLFGQGLGRQIGLNATLFTVVTLIAIWIGQNSTLGGLQPNEQIGQTIAFIILSLTSIWHVFNIRSHKTLLAIDLGFLLGTAKSLQTHGVNRTKDIQGLLDQLSHIK